MKQLRILFLLLVSLLVVNCTAPEDQISTCLSGDCNATFRVDTQGHPGTYQDTQGVWHIKHAGLNYFTIKGMLWVAIDIYKGSQGCGQNKQYSFNPPKTKC